MTDHTARLAAIGVTLPEVDEYKTKDITALYFARDAADKLKLAGAALDAVVGELEKAKTTIHTMQSRLGSSAMNICVVCAGQKAEWQKYGPDDRPIPGFVVCRYCKPDPWTSGSPARQGTYYRPINAVEYDPRDDATNEITGGTMEEGDHER